MVFWQRLIVTIIAMVVVSILAGLAWNAIFNAGLPGYISGTLLARRRAFETVGFFSTELNHGDSLDWFIRARQLGVTGELLPEVLVDRRMHFGNTSRLFEQHSREEFLAILKRSLDKRRSAKPDQKLP